MTWLPGWVCMRPRHPVSSEKAVTCVLSHLVAGARPLSSSSSPLLTPSQTDGLKLYWIFLPERIFSHSPCLSQFKETVRATKFKLFPERQSLGGINRPHLPAKMWRPGHPLFLMYNCFLIFSFQMERNFILFGHLEFYNNAKLVSGILMKEKIADQPKHSICVLIILITNSLIIIIRLFSLKLFIIRLYYFIIIIIFDWCKIGLTLV